MSNIISIKPLGFPWETRDPFLFCVHHLDFFPAGNDNMAVEPNLLKGRNIGNDFVIKDGWRMYHGSKMPGFPYHPHRGFETITINKQGVVDHTDSLGAAGRFMGGDVQWMTAGRGIQHSEMFPLLHTDKPNTLEIFQIWINLPRASKMVEPHFKMLWKEDIPVVVNTDANGKKTTIDVIAGKLHNTNAPQPTPDSWAANEANGVRVLTISMEPEAVWTLPKNDEKANRSLFFYKGNTLFIEGKEIMAGRCIHAVAGNDIEIKNGTEQGFLLVLEGKPINEPVVQYGPFVMNSEGEIRQTMLEYSRTQFGGWPWGATEVAHPRNKGRFALHANGKEEVK